MNNTVQCQTINGGNEECRVWGIWGFDMAARHTAGLYIRMMDHRDHLSTDAGKVNKDRAQKLKHKDLISHVPRRKPPPSANVSNTMKHSTRSAINVALSFNELSSQLTKKNQNKQTHGERQPGTWNQEQTQSQGRAKCDTRELNSRLQYRFGVVFAYCQDKFVFQFVQLFHRSMREQHLIRSQRWNA